MVFKIEMNATFDADNLEDAYILLAAHFESLAEGVDSVLDFNGTMEVRPE